MTPPARLMGVINVTPDSFSDGGLFLDPERAIAHGLELAAEGAEILDVGGESTRPGAEEVGAGEEVRRTEPVIRRLARSGAEAATAGATAEAGAVAGGGDGAAPAISIDTSKLAVAEAALDAGAAIVNDVSALRVEPEIAELVADRGAGLILMHMLGTPRTMQQRPIYDDVVDEVRAFLAERVEVALAAGVAEERIWLDPGIGFGKTLEHNLELLRRLDELAELGRPLVVGASRKSFIGKIDGSEAPERIGGTIAASVLAAASGAEVLRVHDVAEVAQALRVAGAIRDPGLWRQ